MTDRVNVLTVVLDKDIREDDLVGLTDAIRHMRHVCGVRANVSDMTSYMAETRAFTAWSDILIALIGAVKNKSSADIADMLNKLAKEK